VLNLTISILPQLMKQGIVYSSQQTVVRSVAGRVCLKLLQLCSCRLHNNIRYHCHVAVYHLICVTTGQRIPLFGILIYTYFQW